jgi:hypothetical protein
VSLIVSAALERVDLAALLEMRRELVSLGNLLNQALRLSWGTAVDRDALREVVLKLGRLLK